MISKLGVLVSGSGSNLQSIINSIKRGEIMGASIKVVISNKPDAYALERAKKENIPTEYIDSKPYKGRREEYDQLLIGKLLEYGVTPENGLVIMAGYLRIISSMFIKKYSKRIINIHPSLLPAFTGLEAQRQALEYGVKITGCTVHFADEGLDTGPIIIQTVVPVHDKDTVESLRARILDEEHRIYPEAIRLLVDGKYEIEGRKVKFVNHE